LAGIFPASGNIVHALDKVGNRYTTFSYDANGNRTLKQVGGITTQSYSFDCENRLIGLIASTGTYGYTYDHRTRRVGRNESAAGGINSELSFAGGLSVQEYTSGSSLPNVETIRGSDYGGGIGGVLYTIRSGASSYNVYNAYNSRGDVVSKTDDGGAITWQSSYEVFGTRTQENGTTQDRQKANTKHATSEQRATQYMENKKITSSSEWVYGVESKTPGEVTSTQKEIMEQTAAKHAEKVIEFDVAKSELKRDQMRDVILPSPVNIEKRNPTVIDVPKE